ncbi:hypothetical protein A4G19_03475 [Pasteurellaceae bacterium Macca]|nr:hypothetical protein [Pasteurellaceae bacterium Macca]
MQKRTLTLIALSCAITLTACSTRSGGKNHYQAEIYSKPPIAQSGSDQSNHSSSENTTPPPKTDLSNNSSTEKPSTPPVANKPMEDLVQPPKEDKPIIQTKIFQDSTFNEGGEPYFYRGLAGGVYTLKKDGSVQGRAPKNYRDEHINELLLGDLVLPLFTSTDYVSGYEGYPESAFKPLTAKNVVKGNAPADLKGYVGGFAEPHEYAKYQNVRFGIVSSQGEPTLFVQGYLTPVNEVRDSINGTHYPMPKSEVFVYKEGHALYGKEGNYQQYYADVRADFGERKLTVNLEGKQNPQSKIHFSANIEGNKFSGLTDGIESNGAFFGSQANEVGGMFYQKEGADKGAHGVFGATEKHPAK